MISFPPVPKTWPMYDRRFGRCPVVYGYARLNARVPRSEGRVPGFSKLRMCMLVTKLNSHKMRIVAQTVSSHVYRELDGYS